MNQLQFKSVKPNYRKRVLIITLQESKKTKFYQLPFSVFHDLNIHSNNRFEKLEIDEELNKQAVTFKLSDGSKGDFPIDFVLYHCEPSFDWSPINQIKRVLKEQFMKSKLSIRVIADALKTSPTQVIRVLQENKTSKQLIQFFKLIELAGYKLEIKLKKAA